MADFEMVQQLFRLGKRFLRCHTVSGTPVTVVKGQSVVKVSVFELSNFLPINEVLLELVDLQS